MRDEVKDKNLKLQIKLDDETSKGMYVNLALVNHTQGEFTIDAMYVQPQHPLEEPLLLLKRKVILQYS